MPTPFVPGGLGLLNIQLAYGIDDVDDHNDHVEDQIDHLEINDDLIAHEDPFILE